MILYRSLLRVIVLSSILLLSFSNFNVVSPVEGEESTLEEIDDYPQQDGGSDDRLFQYRSMWLEGYQIINSSEVKNVVELARRANINCLSPLINGHYLGVFFNSSYYPRYAELKWDFDPLMELIKEAHKYGINVMPWFHTLYDYPILREHPEWGAKTSTGSISNVWLNPTHPEVRNHLVNVTIELFQNYPLDGIKLDTIRYGGSNYGFSDTSVQKYYDEGWTNFDDFRRMQITEVVEIIYDSITSIRPYVWVGADIWHSYWGWYNQVFQDSRTWAQMGIIDFVTTMSYTTSRSSFESNLRDNLENFLCPVVAGPYVYVPGNTAHGSVPSEEEGIDLLVNQTETAIRLGALGTCFFAYKFLSDWPNYVKALNQDPFSENGICPLKMQSRPVRSTLWNFDNDQDRQGWRAVDTGHFYPYEGVWSISNRRSPKLMSPLLNATSDGMNVLEISMKAESTSGSLKIYWSSLKTLFNEMNCHEVDIVDTGEWNLYSIHLDSNENWRGPIRYIRVVPEFMAPSNLTIDLIQLTWMPYSVRNWSYLGPFLTGTENDLLDRDFIVNENDPRPRLSHTDGGRSWKAFGMERDRVDLRFPLGHLKNAVTYAHVYVRSSVEGPAELRIGNSDGARVFFNGNEVFRTDEPRKVAPDQDIVYVNLQRGINTILIKLAVYQNENSFFIRITEIGNGTIEGLEYFEELPLLSPPRFIGRSSGWIPNNDVRLEWDIPVGSLGLDHFEWILDNQLHGISGGNAITLTDLSDGDHTFELIPVDDMGFYGHSNTTNINVDTKKPIISVPESKFEIVTERSIRWDWDVLFEPISGIDHFVISIENYRSNGSEISYTVRDRTIYESHFILDTNIKDSFKYRIRVKAFSGNGLTHTETSEVPVLVDLVPPGEPWGLNINHLVPGSLEYILTWEEPLENTIEGIDFYQVWSSSDQGNTWSMLEETRSTEYEFERPPGEVLDFKIRAVDTSKQIGMFSSVESTENIPPKPSIILSEGIFEGLPFNVQRGMLDDIDGIVLESRWYLNGELVSNLPFFNLTLETGDFLLELFEIDDLGSESYLSTTIHVLDDGPYLNGSLTDELITGSVLDVDLPPDITYHYNNITVLVDNSSAESDDDVVTDIFVFITIIMIVSFLAVLMILTLVTIVLKELRQGIIRKSEPIPVRTSKKKVSRSNGLSVDLDRLKEDRGKTMSVLSPGHSSRPRIKGAQIKSLSSSSINKPIHYRLPSGSNLGTSNTVEEEEFEIWDDDIEEWNGGDE